MRLHFFSHPSQRQSRPGLGAPLTSSRFVRATPAAHMKGTAQRSAVAIRQPDVSSDCLPQVSWNCFALYASPRALPRAMQNSLPAGGLHLCRAGGEPAGSLPEFQFISSSFPGLRLAKEAFARGALLQPVTPGDRRSLNHSRVRAQFRYTPTRNVRRAPAKGHEPCNSVFMCRRLSRLRTLWFADGNSGLMAAGRHDVALTIGPMRMLRPGFAPVPRKRVS